MITVFEASKILGVSRRTAYNYIYRGLLPAVRTSPVGHLRISQASLDAFLEGCRPEPVCICQRTRPTARDTPAEALRSA